MNGSERESLYAYFLLYSNGVDNKVINENQELFSKLCEDLQKGSKNSCDLNLSFVSGENKLFEIQSADKTDEIYFQIDISRVNFDLLSQLLFGVISCSYFLYKSSKLIDEKSPSMQYHEMLEKANMSWQSFLERVGYKEEDFVSPDEAAEAKKIIKKKNILWCYNKSCSGKTFLGIHTLACLDGDKFVFNPAVGNTCDVDMIKLLLEFGTNCELLIDDLQCDVELARNLLKFICANVENIQSRNIHIFLISWSSLACANEFSDYTGKIETIQTNPQKFINLLKREIDDPQLLNICRDNLALISTARRLKREQKEKEGICIDELFHYFVQTTENQQLKTIHVLAVLGMYELEAPIPFIKTYGTLKTENITTIKIVDNAIFLAHRTICKFIAEYIEEREKGCELYRRQDIITNYINYIDSTKKWKVLLHLMGESNRSDISAVSPIWNLMYECQKNLKKRSEINPSWKNTPSSMYFVISTANMLGTVEEYKKVIDALCSNFIVKEEGIEIRYDLLKTTDDFVTIKKRMKDEDRINGDHLLEYESGASIDRDRMHRNWLFGLMIGLKDVLIEFGYGELVQRIEEKLFELQDDEGYWYPKRVPWVTARILIGLGEAHYTVENEVVSKGIRYLLSMISDDRWKAHTGTWNKDFETSSLCLEAFIKCHADYEGEATKKVQDYLCDSSPTWMSPKYEIDGAPTACTLIKILGIQDDLLDYINELAKRNIHNIINQNESIDYTKEQSCKVTQIAYYVIELCWYILEKDIFNVLEEFMERSEQETERKKMERKKIFISYSMDSPSHIKKVARIAEHLEKEGYEVYFYGKAVIGVNNIVFMQKIEHCDAILVIGTKEYKRKSSEEPSGGTFTESCIISSEFMNSHYEKIIPLAFDEFEESFPKPFNSNKGMRVKRVDKYFLEKLTLALREKF